MTAVPPAAKAAIRTMVELAFGQLYTRPPSLISDLAGKPHPGDYVVVTSARAPGDPSTFGRFLGYDTDVHDKPSAVIVRWDGEVIYWTNVHVVTVFVGYPDFIAFQARERHAADCVYCQKRGIPR